MHGRPNNIPVWLPAFALGVCIVTPAAGEGYVDPAAFDRISATVRELSSHGSRLPGYPGDRYAADFVERELRAAVEDAKEQCERMEYWRRAPEK